MKNKHSLAIVIFALTFLGSFAVNKVTGNYWIHLSYKKSFTLSEAENIIGKNIVDICLKKPAGNQGLITNHEVSKSGERLLIVKWDQPILDKLFETKQGIEFFEACTKVID